MKKIKEPIIKILNSEKISKNKEIKELLITNEVINYKLIDYIDSCHIKKTIFSNECFSEYGIFDSILEDCDLSNEGLNSLTRVVFKNCNLVGCNFIDVRLENVVFDTCKCSYINIASSTLKQVKFINTNLEFSRFYDTTLKDVYFQNCYLKNTEFVESSLKKIDLSSSNIEGISADLESLRGVIIDKMQSIDIVELLGVEFI